MTKTKPLNEIINGGRTARAEARRDYVFIPEMQTTEPEKSEAQAILARSAGLISNVLKPGSLITPFGSLAYGLYLVLAEPNAGKSITTLGITLWHNFTPAKKGLKQTMSYLSISEPRSEPNAAFGVEELQFFPNRLGGYIDEQRSKMTNLGGVVVDSAGLAMRSYPREKTETATMKEGMEIGDQKFCRVLQADALKREICIFLLVGTTEVPFADKLEGLVEGIVIIRSPGQFNVRFRGKLSEDDQRARVDSAISVPQQFIDASAIHLGY